MVAMSTKSGRCSRSMVAASLRQCRRLLLVPPGSYDVTTLVEPTFLELIDSARNAVAEKPDVFVVVGGDGMVNLAAQVLAGTKVPMGLVPSGTGNDMARGLGIPIGLMLGILLAFRKLALSSELDA